MNSIHLRTRIIYLAGALLLCTGLTTSGWTARGLSKTPVIPRSPESIEPDGALDPLFVPAPVTDAEITSTILQPDGKLLIAGRFTKVNGVSRSGIARLNADGTLDTSFDPGTGVDLGVGVTQTNSGMIRQNDGKVVIYGFFSLVNGVARNGIARLNGDGSLDAAFDPGGVISPDGVDPGGTVWSVVMQSDGKFVVTGQFFFVLTGAETAVARSCVARFNNDGSFDDAYDPGAGLDYTVDPSQTRGLTVVRQSNDRVILSGLFDRFDGNVVPSGLVRLNTNGSYDASFNPGTGVLNLVSGLFVQSDDQVIVFGNFTTFSGGSHNNMVRLAAATGAIDAGFNTAAFKVHADKGAVFGVTQQADGKLLVGGLFHSLGTDAAEMTVRLNTNGTRDATFDTSMANPLGNLVDGFAVRSSDSKIFIAGRFSSYNGGNRNCIALVNSDGSLDNAFAPSGGATDQYPQVEALAAQADGKVLAGGVFTSAGGEPRNNLFRFNQDGSIDHTFAVAAGTYGSVRAILIQPDSKIMIAGQFRAVDSTPASKVARLNADGTIDPGFNPGSGPDNVVWAMTQDGSGNTYIAGDFLNVNGTPRAGLAKLASNGSLDNTFNPGTGFNGSPRAMAPPNGTAGVVIGGLFTSYNGATVNRIVRVDPATAARDTAFTTANGTGFGNGSVRALGITATGQYLVGGNFSSFNGTTQPGLLRLNSNGARDSGYASTVSGQVFSMAQQANGKVVVGGIFSTPRVRVARFNTNGSLDNLFNPGGGPVVSPFLAFLGPARVDAITVAPDGKLIIGGVFNQYNGAPRVCVARLTDSQLFYSAVSRKVHDGTPRDINLPLTGNSGIECRSGGATNDYQVVFTFPGTVTFSGAAVSAGSGTVGSSSGSGTNTITANLTGLMNAQRITVTLSNVSDGTSTADLGVTFGVLVGDATGDAVVNSGDATITRNRSGQSTDVTNFRSDFNLDGNINSGDAIIVRSRSGQFIP